MVLRRQQRTLVLHASLQYWINKIDNPRQTVWIDSTGLTVLDWQYSFGCAGLAALD